MGCSQPRTNLAFTRVKLDRPHVDGGAEARGRVHTCELAVHMHVNKFIRVSYLRAHRTFENRSF